MRRTCALLSVSIILFSMLGSLAVQIRADLADDYVPLKWAVIITGGFDYYRTGWYWSYNTIQRLENYMQGRGVPYDLIKDTDLESARDTPSPGKYPLQFADGTPRYQVLVLQTNDYSSVAVSNKDLILQAVQSGTNAVLFGKALAVFPELFGLSSSDVLSENWPTPTYLTVKVTDDFDDGVVNGAYTAGTQITMGAETSHVECTTLNDNGKTVYFHFLRNGDWRAIGMMSSTYGEGRVWFNVYDMSDGALEYTSQLYPTWVSQNMGFWAHSINFMLNSAAKISVHIMPFETWKGAWILRTDRDSNSWRNPAPVEAFEAGWKWLEGFCVLGYGRVPNGPVALHQGPPTGYVGIPSGNVMWADLVGVPKNDAARTLVSYKMILYNSVSGGSYDRIRIDFNNDFDFSDDTEYKVWDDITYPDIIGTLFWCYISPDFANPTSIGLGWKQTPILFDDDALTALKDVAQNYGELYTFHSFYHFDVGYDYQNGGFLRWDEATQTFVQDPTYVRQQFEAAKVSMIQSFGSSGYGFESDDVVLHYSGNIFPMWVREVVGQIPWILYEIGGGAGPGGFCKASDTTKWMLPCYGSEAYETYYPTYVEAIQTLYPFMAVFQHDDLYNLNFNKAQMRPFTNDITIADAISVYNFFINSRTMLQNVNAAYYQNGQIVLDFDAASGLVDYTWVLPSTIDGNQYAGFSDSANVAAFKSNDGQNVFIESSQGQGHQILTVNYNQAVTVTVSAADGGTISPVAGEYQVAQNTVFTVSATASSGYTFDHWVLDGANIGSTNPYSFNVGTTDHTIKPVYTAVSTVNVVILFANGGTTSPVAGQYPVSINSNFQVSATASSGYTFDHWVLDGTNVGPANPYSFNVGTTSHTVGPVFIQVLSKQISSCDSLTYWSFTSATGSVDNGDFKEGTGSIAVTPTGTPWIIYAQLQPSTKMDFSSYSKVEAWIKVSDSTKQLQLMVATDWSNYNWYTITGLTSNVWTKATIDLLTPTSKTGTVNFNSISFIRFAYSNAQAAVSLKIDDIRGTYAQSSYSLTVTALGSGSVVKSPDQTSYHLGDVVQLTATPTAGWSFSGWSGALIGSTNPASLTITGDISVTATFTQNTYALTVTTSGSGSVDLDNDGPYHYGDVVQLTAVPTAGWGFSGWSGDLGGFANPTTITIDRNKAVIATFTRIVYTLTISTSGSGSVSTDKSAPYHYGDVVALTAAPTTGWSFLGWSGDLSGTTNPQSIMMDGNKAVTAAFTKNEYTLTTSAVGSGSITQDNNGPYHYGDIIQLTAVPSAGWGFNAWSGDASGSANPVSVTIDSDKMVTATFTQNTYTLTITSVGSGSVTRSPDQASYHYGDVVQLTATPASGWSFQSWSGDVSGSVNPISVTINGPTSATAAFIQNAYTLTMNTVGSGSVSKVPDQASYHLGDVVQLTASPTVGWSFSGWSGALTGSTNPASLTITGDMSVTATFTQDEYSLTVTVAPSSAAGSVSASVAGPYHWGDVVTLTPSANLGYTFSRWTGDGVDGAGNTRVVTVSGNMAVTAAFAQNEYTLTINYAGDGSGSVSTDKLAPYYYGEVVQLTATPNAGNTFSGFTGDLSGATSPVSITIDGNKAVTATFTRIAYMLTISTSQSGSVSTDKFAPYYYGDIVQLTATPSAGWSFSSWSGDATGSVNPVSVTIDRNKAVTATFIQNEYTLTANTVGSGSITKIPDQASYHYGDVVQLTATPASGWSFGGWSGDLSDSQNPASLTIDGHKSVTATFTRNVYSLTISYAGDGFGSVSTDKSAPYHYGDVVQLTATAAAGSSFSGFTGDLNSAMSPASITIEGNKAVTATFIQNTYTLTVNTVGSGSVTKSPDQATYHYGDIVQLTANPAAGWSFSAWSGDVSGSANPVSVTIDGNKAVTATFTQNTYTLTITPVGSGSVTKSPDQASYHFGDAVQLTAVPAAGWSFNSWSGALTGSTNPVSLTINGNVAVAATFTQNMYALTVTTSGSGSVNLDNNGPYHYGDVVQLTAIPSTGWSFSEWSGDLSGTTNPTTITIDGNKAVTATFTQNEYTLTITTVGSGSVVKVPDQASYYNGDVVQLTATPATGWTFSGWSGDLSGSTSQTTIRIDSNKAVTATFTQNAYTLTVSIVGSGSVTRNPDQASYHYGDVVVLTESPSPGYTFSGWSGDGSGTGSTRSVTVAGNVAVAATFTQNVYSLTIDYTGDGSGSVSTDKSAPYHYGDVVQLIATPAAGSSFSGWSGDLGGSANPQSLTIDGNKAVIATFRRIVYALTISTSGSGSVSTDKSAPYHWGDVVELTATPAAGWSFSAWSGDASGSVNPISITIDGNKAVTAAFTQKAYTLTISTVGSGSVTKSPDQASYQYGDVVQLTAFPTAGWSFSRWSGDLAGSTNPASLAITSDMSVTAIFAQITYTLTITTSGSGTVNPDNFGPYHHGDVVQLTAVPATGWGFSAWSGDLSGSTNPTTITIDDNKAVTATFTQNVYTLTISYAGDGSGSVSTDKLAPYHYGDVVQLTAASVAGSSFNGFTGDLNSATSPASITIDDNKAVTANFTRIVYTLTISTSGSGSVSTDKSAPYYLDDVVELKATPTSGWSFSAWSGDASGSVNPVRVTIDGNKAVTATFTQDTYTLTITAVGSGSVTKSPAQASYHYGDVAQLTATPAAGWSFSSWSGDLTGSANPASVTITGNMSVTAAFTQNSYTVVFTETGLPSGTQWSAILNGTTRSSTTSTITFNILSGTYNWSATNPILGASKTRYFTATPSGTIGVTQQTLIPITYITQYQVSFAVSPSKAGTTSPSGTNVWTTADPILISATANSGYVFNQWSTSTGSITIDNAKSATATATIGGPGTITANFVAATYTVTFQENNLPSGTSWNATLNGVTHTSTTNIITFTIAAGTYSWSVSNPISGGTGIRYVTSTPSGRTTVSGSTTIQIQYRTQYYVTMQVTPAGAGSTSPSSGWYDAGTTVSMTATPKRGYTFVSWTGTGTGSYTGPSASATVIMYSPITEMATFSRSASVHSK